MSEVFGVGSALVQEVRVVNGDFNIGAAAIQGATDVESLYGIVGWAELAHVGTSQAGAPGVEDTIFRVFGTPEGAPYLEDATWNAMGDGKAQTLLPAGAVAVIGPDSLAELTKRASMSSGQLIAYKASLATAQGYALLDCRLPSVTVEHLIPGVAAQRVMVCRYAASSLLNLGEGSLATPDHYTVALGGLGAILLRVRTLDPTTVIYRPKG